MQKNKYNLRVRRSEEKDYEAIVHLMNEWNSELDIKDQANP